MSQTCFRKSGLPVFRDEARQKLSSFALMSLDTRGIDPQRLLPQSLEDRLLGWLGRCGGIVLLSAVALVWLSLLSWSLSDPSLTHATTAVPRNWLGPLGAVFSDLLLQTFGFAAVIGLLAPMVWGLELIGSERVTSGRVKLLYYPLSISAIAGGLSAFPVIVSWPLHHGYGGLMGDGLFRLVSNLFAILNADRANLASALVLNSGAVAMLAKSIGLDLETVIRDLLTPAEKTENRIEPKLAAKTSQAVSGLWASWRAKKSVKAANSNPYGAAAELAVPGYAPDPNAPQNWTGGYRQAYTHVPAGLAAAHAQQFGQSYPHQVQQAYGEPHGFGVEAPAGFGAYEIEAAMAGRTAAQAAQHIPRGSGFDQNTEAASRAIAARFAPSGAGSVATPSERQTPATSFSKTTPAQQGKVSGLLGGLSFRKSEPDWKRPSLNLLKRPSTAKPGPEFTQTVMRGNARLLEDVLADFGVKGEVKDIKPGPVVTLYEMEPARGTKSSRVIGLADDIARSMSVTSVRAAVVPGRNAIGLELPNVRREPVMLREILESDLYKTSDSVLPLALGKSIGGEPVVVDLARMPHLLVAGTTGSGKSVGVNAMILSLLYRHSPQECRLLMIDPKMLELSVYNGIPHLLTPVVTDPHKAVTALNWAVSEMEERYKRMSTLSVRNIDVFNNRVRNAKTRGEMLSRNVQTGFDKQGQAVFENQKMNLEAMPHIVIVVDEFADLMIVAGKEVEAAVQRLAQMARAAGIHLIMATQRPSVDIVTGTIKANFPTRISFKVTSKIDSRTILNEQGAEQLLGQGDMLYSTGAGNIVRVHGAFVADEEVEAIAEALRAQGPPLYVDGILDSPQVSEIASGERQPTDDDLYDRAVAIVLRDHKASTSYIQRRLSIGYNRAADLIERMEREGLISPANNVGKREIMGSATGNENAA